MKRLVRLVLGVSMAVTGCAGQARPRGGGWGEETTTSAAVRRSVGIYEAVIRRLVSTEDSTFGADPGFPAIFVVERADPGVADPGTGSVKGEPLPDEVKRGLQESLSDLPIEFVGGTEGVVIPVEDGGGVKDGGVVVTLGPIPEGDERVEVGASLYAGPLAATWLTYVVERSGEAWEVTGTTGPVAVS